jgi:serine/threonine protein kinase
MTEIRLSNGVWQLDENSRLGPAGGFGEVFRGAGPDGPVAIKRIKTDAHDAAHREMDLGRVLAGRNLQHVVPVLDHGHDVNGDRYYLVMPICDYSLQDHLKKTGPMAWDTAKDIVLDIIAGLQEVGDIVHRDLKPGNVLQHEGRWKLADFGIAKFVQDNTSARTLRDVLTITYAAPEQWRGERPTGATDIYALGCIIHAIIDGRPPFLGNEHDIQDGHLTKEPPPLNNVDPRLETFVNQMLRKVAANRPPIERCRKVLSELTARPLRPGSAGLAAAGAKIAQEQLAAEAARRSEEDARQARRDAAAEAARDLNGIMARLFGEITAASSMAAHVTPRHIKLAPAEMAYEEPSFLLPRQNSSGWDVIAASILRVGGRVDRMARHQPEFYTFDVTLAYSQILGDPSYRWRAISFFNWSNGSRGPFALRPDSSEFHLALSKVVSGWETAYGPTPIDAEDEDAFIDRWIKLFTKAVNGRLNPPNNIPVPDSYFD